MLQPIDKAGVAARRRPLTQAPGFEPPPGGPGL